MLQGLRREDLDDSFWRRTGYTRSSSDVVLRTRLTELPYFIDFINT